VRGFWLSLCLASAVAHADVVSLSGDLVQTKGAKLSHPVALDARRGWAVEARFEMAPTARVDIEITDDRLTSRFVRVGMVAILDGESYQLIENPYGMHTFRIEASTGRRLLLVDGQVVLDRDQALAVITLAAPTKVEFGAQASTAGSPPLAHFESVTVDAAPTGLATSSVPYQSAIPFTGPFAPWLWRYATRASEVAPQLAQIQLPEAARACVAFDIVAAGATKKPKHYRAGEMQKPPKGIEPPPPQIDFDLIETPPMQARKRPMMRRNRTPADVRAQGELISALSAKDPKPFYERAVQIMLNEGAVNQEGMALLLAWLPELAKHPTACR
jgi:hypothetical protein